MPSDAKHLVWLKMWYRPRVAASELLEAGRGHGVALVSAVLFGLVQSARVYAAGQSGPGVFVLGGLFGLAGLYLFAWLLRNFGRWFKSEARPRELRTILGIALLPWTLLFIGLSVLLGVERDAAALGGYFPLFFIGFLYGYLILLLGLSAALKLNISKTFLCLAVTILVSLFPLTLLAQLLFGNPAAMP